MSALPPSSSSASPSPPLPPSRSPADGRTGPGAADGYAIFLRGVNVGGITLRMADLRDLLATLPLRDVATVLASGNAVCRTEMSAADLASRTEKALRTRFGYEAWVVVVGAADLRTAAASVPATSAATGTHTYVTFFSTAEALGTFLDEASELPDRPLVLAGCPAVAWTAPRGGSTEVPLARLLARKRFSTTSTTRNVTTLTKVLRLLEVPPGGS